MRLCTTVLAVVIASVSVPIGAGAARAADPMIGAPTVGQCSDYDYAAMMKEAAPGGLVECSSRHTAITVAVVPLPEGMAMTGDTHQAFDYLIDSCRSAFDAGIGVGHKLQHVTAVTRTYYLPPQDLVDQGARWGQCDVVSMAGTTLVPIAATTPLVTTSKPTGDMLRCLNKDYYATSCSRAHAWEPNVILTLRGSAFPSKAAQIRFGQRRCGAVTGQGHRYIFYAVRRSAWQRGERHIVCWQSR